MFNKLGYNFQGGQNLLRKIRTFEIKTVHLLKKSAISVHFKKRLYIVQSVQNQILFLKKHPQIKKIF